MGRMLKSLLYLVFLFCCVEFGLRLIPVLPLDFPPYVHDPDIGYRVRPDSVYGNVRTNQRGYNDYDHPVTRQDGKSRPRIAFVGDSFTFGNDAYQKIFPHMVEKRLRERGLDVEALNMGISGTSPRQYLAVMRTDVWQFDPDLVVVTVFVMNDIIQSHPDFKTVAWFGDVKMLPRFLRFWPSPEHLYTFKASRMALRQVVTWMAGDASAVAGFPLSLLTKYGYELEIYRRTPNRFTARAYDGISTVLDAMNREARRHDTSVLVVIAPSEMQLNGRLRQAVLDRKEERSADFRFDLPQQRLTGYLEKVGLPYINLLAVFRRHPAEEILYSENDVHWNENGNTLAASEIADRLALAFTKSLDGPFPSLMPR